MRPAETKAPVEPDPPAGFRMDHGLPLGRHPILTVFPGLDKLPPGRTIHPDAKVRRRLFADTYVELVDADMWMYVAPWEVPAIARGRWRPVVTPGTDCIVVGHGHFRESLPLIVYLDIYHELCHILQRHGGANLFEPGLSYVERPTEVEAYRFVVVESRRLGVSDEFVREYLRVEWITKREHLQLLKTLDVPPPPKKR
ncbi:MAG: hypothetical protein L3K02_01920 [Thermoplasmata archaeon]|nr:hypothetical protein [Thermoplasmata archaeon]